MILNKKVKQTKSPRLVIVVGAFYCCEGGTRTHDPVV